MNRLAIFPVLLLCLLAMNAMDTSGCFSTEREALLGFRAGLNVTNSTLLPSWSGEDCCRWVGVVCDANTGHVVKLKLRNIFSHSNSCEMEGQINSSLLALTELKHLDLSMNGFLDIPIPEFIGSFKKLRYLNLSYNCFNGGIPAQFRNLSRLHVLDLYFALAYGRGPIIDNLDWLSHLFASLKYLDLSGLDLTHVTNWFYSVNMLSSLNVLRMAFCSLSGGIPAAPTHVNFTSVVTLDMTGNNFYSSLPKWLWNISSLTNLDLSSCSLNGTIPDALGNLNSLTFLNLQSNENLEGVVPMSIANLHRLESLFLAFNKLTGNLTGWLEQLTSLKVLDLSNNLLNGPLPAAIGKLSNLTQLHLQGNLFEGPLPAAIGKLSSLTELSLDHNLFEGIVSEVHLNNLPRLESIDLSGNSLTVSINHTWPPPFQLRYIGLSSCRLGPQIPEWLRSQMQIEELYLSDSRLAGILPSWFWNISSSTIETLELSNNKIGGRFLPPSELKQLRYLNLDSNLLEGPLPVILPPMLHALSLSNNFFTGQLPTWPNVMELSLSNNMLDDITPICEFKVLVMLNLSNNNLSGDIPHCLGELRGLELLNLANNKFSGEIPGSVSFLSELNGLQLNNNSLSGEFPLSLQNCTELVLLNLAQNNFSGSIPSWIEYSLPFLVVLQLRSNNFSGPILWQLGRLSSLQILDLADNNFSESIPHSIFNLTAMASMKRTSPIEVSVPIVIDPDEGSDVFWKGKDLFYERNNDLYLMKSLDLSSNNLIGEIPEEIGRLVGLQNLNLSRNHLTGKIPQRIGEMISIESLDLSENKLFGNIPESLFTLTFLSHLNLSYNNLTAMIPSGYQLQTLNDPSIYIRNPGLCGSPISKNCSSKGTIVKGVGKQENVESSEIVWIYISMMPGYVVGFWVFWGVLILKREWRYAYFCKIDDLFDRMLLQWQLLLLRLHGP